MVDRRGVVVSMNPLDPCRDSLDGLSVGEALGAQFLVPGTAYADLPDGRPPRGLRSSKRE
jgi:hypothetical protein